MIDIKDTNHYEIDVFLKVTNQEERTAYEIIEEHIKVTKENPEGYTWWGNNQNYSPDRVRGFISEGHKTKALMVIPSTSEGSDNIEYIADIIDSMKNNDKCFPKDEWRPEYYKDVKHKVWIKLNNFKKININRDKIDISQYYMLSNNDRLDSKMQSQFACGYVYRYKIDYEELYEEQYQALIADSEATNTDECPQPKPSTRANGKGKVWMRNPSIAKEALKVAKYKCEFDSKHITFISEKTGENFVEAHHLIPMKNQDNFKHSIDVPGNIVSLCPNCHRAIHLSEIKYRENILKEIYNKRKDKLERYGIYITLDELLSMYK